MTKRSEASGEENVLLYVKHGNFHRDEGLLKKISYCDPQNVCNVPLKGIQQQQQGLLHGNCARMVFRMHKFSDTKYRTKHFSCCNLLIFYTY